MNSLKPITEHIRPNRPITVAQFGGGVFLRGFFDWMLQKANDAGVYNGNATVIRAKTRGTDPLSEQNYLYTHVSRDADHCDVTLIDSIAGSLNPSESPEEFFALAVSPTLETVVSNTTEAGIVYEYCGFTEASVPESYPARLTRLLYERYKEGLSGLLILPCELIENNGSTLCEIVKKHAEDWSLDGGFLTWLSSECSFRNTLVDRIVSGKAEEQIPLSYTDNAVNTSEFFHLWVIEGEEDRRLPFASIGLNIKWVKDVNEYRTLKVRILNGAHTSMIPYALLSGVETVGECMRTEITRKHLTACLFDEIIPSLGEEKLNEATEYSMDVIKRFKNPYICHRCEAISLNSVSKFKVRVLPSILEYSERHGKSPRNLLFAFAQLIRFYKEGTPKDDERVIAFIRASTVKEILSSTELWDRDLSYLSEEIERNFSILIHRDDNVEVNLSDGQKYAVCDIKKGETVIKYGFPIGLATRDIKSGEKVCPENIRSRLSGVTEWSYRPIEGSPIATENAFFNGYLRKDGRAGIRNDIWVIPTVGCINGVARELAEAVGGKALTHPYGCSQLGDDLENTRKTLAALARHPNAGGVLVLGLGCENNLIDGVRSAIETHGGDHDRNRIKYLNIQDCSDEIEEGLALLRELKAITEEDKRTQIPISKLKIGVKCGGSDGYSGITANPLIGQVAEKFALYGASVLMTELPEAFGAEEILLSRCKTKAIFDRTAEMLNGFRKYYIDHGEKISENPSPGNIAGGISTLEEKSLGCVQKGGRVPVVGASQCWEHTAGAGLHIVNGPGNDMVAVTNLMAAGANMILFSTGRGTPLSAPVPTVKISTNSALAEKKPHWIDYDAGRMLSETVENHYAEQLFELCQRVAEGETVKGERNGYSDIAIFKNGVTL